MGIQKNSLLWSAWLVIIYFPSNHTGSWINALREILKSVYGYFNYDIDSYIASELETQPRSHGACDEGSSDTELEEEGGSREVAGEGDSSTEQEEAPMEDDNLATEQMETERRSSIIRNMAPKLQRTPSNKTISSFTVENILMGKQSPNSTGSSATTSVSSHSPTSSTAASLPSPTPLGPISSSIVGVNWVSHPPVKYTKFTILSPTAMSNEAKRKKSTDASPQSSSARSEEGAETGQASPVAEFRNNSKQVSRGLYARQTSSEASASPTPVYTLSSLSTGANTLSELRTSTPLPTSATILPVVTTLQPSSGSTPDGKVVLTKSFPPSQQYVLLMPSSSGAGAPAAHSAVPLTSSGLTQRAVTFAPSGLTQKPVTLASSGLTQKTVSLASSGLTQKSVPLTPSGLTQKAFTTSVPVGNSVRPPSIIRTVSFQGLQSSASTAASSSNTRASSSSNFGSGSSGERSSTGNRHSNEFNFCLIAPKQKQRMSRSTGSARGRSKLRGRVPQKLRFHMTTVVTKQKKVPVKSSMTVESPSVAAVGSPQNPSTSHHTSSVQSSARAGTLPIVPVENTITRSPNTYSSLLQKGMKGEAPGRASQPPCAPTSVGEGRPSSKNHTRQHGIHNGASPSSGAGPSSIYTTGSTENLHAAATTRHKKSSENSLSADQQSSEPMGTPRHRGRATRSYTRRKRELTFHLYEDPGTAFRAKRGCKE